MLKSSETVIKNVALGKPFLICDSSSDKNLCKIIPLAVSAVKKKKVSLIKLPIVVNYVRNNCKYFSRFVTVVYFPFSLACLKKYFKNISLRNDVNKYLH